MLSRGFNSKAEYVRSLIREDVEEAGSIGLGEKILSALRDGTDRGILSEPGEELVMRTRAEHSSESAGDRLDRVLDSLRSHKAELLRKGVVHAAVFGSTARGEASPSSDVDILVDLDPKRSLGVFEFVGIAQYLEEIIPGSDVVERKALKPLIRERILSEAIVAY